MHKTAIIMFTSQFVSMAIPSVKHISVGQLRVTSINQPIPVNATTQVSLLFEKCLGGPTAKDITTDNTIQKSLSKAVSNWNLCTCITHLLPWEQRIQGCQLQPWRLLPDPRGLWLYCLNGRAEAGDWHRCLEAGMYGWGHAGWEVRAQTSLFGRKKSTSAGGI